MRIYRMSATFGKLEHQTLTLEPGLNVITAPNEWGKSTWCAFLIAMFYGLDTRAKTTKNALADKERYAPWSGAPMEGRIDLNWNGRDITIQRSTKRRVPLGEFSAFETASGLPVKELTAANCGQLLLGVEQTVFRRAGFIRLADLPVTQDEALRRRLNALVTTGDDSAAGDKLAQELKDLRNRCRYNKSGLLPQEEARRDGLEAKLRELEELEQQCRKLKMRLGDVKDWIDQLRNHQQALAYAAAEADARQVAQARERWEQAQQELAQKEAACAGLPPREETERRVRELRSFREEWNAMQLEIQMLPQEPKKPELPAPFTGMTVQQARQTVQDDAQRYATAMSRLPAVLAVIGVLGVAAAALLARLGAYLPAAGAGAVALIALVWCLTQSVGARRDRRTLLEKYGGVPTTVWTDPIDAYEEAVIRYETELKAFRDASGDVDVRGMVLRKRRETLCGQLEPQAALEQWQQRAAAWDDYHTTRREAVRLGEHLQALTAVVRPVAKPAMEDRLTHTEAETGRLLSECLAEQQRLQHRLGQYQGRMETLGDRADLEKELEACRRRIARLEDTYAALTVALDTLTAARAELQRRFAPRIARRAQELLGAMTGGRYQSLTLGEDFSLQTAAQGEEAQRDSLWRSDGTVDQLYLALRLAVAQELTPEAPLILDDALVRFDDARLASAMAILKELGREKQVLVFTCQSREAKL